MKSLSFILLAITLARAAPLPCDLGQASGAGLCLRHNKVSARDIRPKLYARQFDFFGFGGDDSGSSDDSSAGFSAGDDSSAGSSDDSSSGFSDFLGLGGGDDSNTGSSDDSSSGFGDLFGFGGDDNTVDSSTDNVSGVSNDNVDPTTDTSDSSAGDGFFDFLPGLGSDDTSDDAAPVDGTNTNGAATDVNVVDPTATSNATPADDTAAEDATADNTATDSDNTSTDDTSATDDTTTADVNAAAAATCAPVSPPTINTATVNLIKDFEGFVPSPEPDPIGLPTVGFGHKCQRNGCSEVPFSFPLSQTTAATLLQTDAKTFTKCLAGFIDKSVTLNDNQFGALTAFAFNLGCGAVQKSTLLKRLNAGENPNTVAAQELPKFNKAGGKVLAGLTRRRAAEVALFQTASTTVAHPPC